MPFHKPGSSVRVTEWLLNPTSSPEAEGPWLVLRLLEALTMSDVHFTLPPEGDDVWSWLARAWWLWGIIAPRVRRWREGRRPSQKAPPAGFLPPHRPRASGRSRSRRGR